jgi:hypothetical protein
MVGFDRRAVFSLDDGHLGESRQNGSHLTGLVGIEMLDHHKSQAGVSGGVSSKNSRRDSMPPAEAPMPTMDTFEGGLAAMLVAIYSEASNWVNPESVY